jgi:hypothetical protein
MTSGMPESTVATREFVVPKSMPTILLIRFIDVNTLIPASPFFILLL